MYVLLVRLQCDAAARTLGEVHDRCAPLVRQLRDVLLPLRSGNILRTSTARLRTSPLILSAT
jgi:hypothetical protein